MRSRPCACGAVADADDLELLGEALATRRRPCWRPASGAGRAANGCSRSSSGGVTTSVSPSRAIGDRRRAIVVLELPFGPFTATWLPSMVTSTPLGNGDGLLADSRHDVLRYQTWQRTSPPTRRSARLAVGHETLVRGQDGDAHAAEHAGHVVGLRCRRAGRASTRAADPGDRALAVGRVLHLDRQAGGPGDAGRRRPRSPRCSPRARGSWPALPSASTTASATSSWNAMLALRMRVSMSAIGSVIVTARHPPHHEPSSRREPRRRAPSRAGRCGTARSRGTPSARGRTAGSACSRAP